MNEDLIKLVEEKTNLSTKQISAVLSLLEEGATIPFIARYRKEVTGNLDEEQIRNIVVIYEYEEKLAKRKEEVLNAIEKKDKLGNIVGYIVNDEKIVDKIFNLFNNGLNIPTGKSGKLIHTYVDTSFEEEITDCQGHTSMVSEMSYIHLEPTGYNLGLSKEYSELLMLFNLSDFEYEKYITNDLSENKIKEYIRGKA